MTHRATTTTCPAPPGPGVRVFLVIAILLAVAPIGYAFSYFDEGSTTPAWQALASFVVGAGALAAAGALARAMSPVIELDERGIRVRFAGRLRAIEWADGPRLVEGPITAVGRLGVTVTRMQDVYVISPRGTQIRWQVVRGPTGAALDPAAEAMLAAVRDRLSRAGAGAAVAGGLVVSGTYAAIPRAAWITGGLAALVLAAASKLAIVDRALDVALYPLGLAVLAALPMIVALARRGTLTLDDASLRGARAIGGGFEIARGEIVRIEPHGSTRSDDLGVRIVRTSGAPITLARVRPEAIRIQLLAIGTPRAS